MVSLRKMDRASFGANGFFQMSKRHPPASGSHTLVFAIFDKSRFVAEFGRVGIRRAFVSCGMGIVRPLDIFMDLNARLANGDIGRMRINPSSAIVIVDAVLTLVH